MNPFATFRITDDRELRVDYPETDPSQGTVACAIEGIEDPSDFAAAFAAARRGDRAAIGFYSARNEAVLTLLDGEVEARLDLPDDSPAYVLSWPMFEPVLADWVAAWNALGQAPPEGG